MLRTVVFIDYEDRVDKAHEAFRRPHNASPSIATTPHDWATDSAPWAPSSAVQP